MDTNFIEAIGYCGTLATVATYSMRSIVPLRVAGIASSIFFIAYAAIMGVWPMLLTEFVILPINCWRLYQVLRTGSALARPACSTAASVARWGIQVPSLRSPPAIGWHIGAPPRARLTSALSLQPAA